jgi:predicted phosphodiesterase
MKIAVASDIHLEFGPIVFENTGGADVLILSGDICVAKDLLEHDSPMPTEKSQKLHDFFYNCCNKFPHVVYVVGNHEHYHYDFAHTVKDLKKNLKYLPNLQILDKESWTLFDEVTFVGGTLWTDMNKEDPLTIWHIGRAMNDFRCVKNSANQVGFWVENDGKRERKYRDSSFSPEDAVKEHRAMVDYIRTVVEGKYDHKFVVVGHHAPSRLSTHPRYKEEALMNGGYSSSLDEFILERPQIKLWTHGHTHEDFDYMLGTTRIVCNPRGYINYEARADNFQLKYVEV